MSEGCTVPVVVPAYEPDSELIDVCQALIQNRFKNIIIVNDGSGHEFDDIFEKVEQLEECVVLKHAVNLGKGRALKTAFNYILCSGSMVDSVGCITADSDGQHIAEDILNCAKMLCEHQSSLIMGCRNFSGEGIPWKSVFGNELTIKVCRYLCGINVSDTQTGLRGIPRAFMEELLNVPGERFEFETNMLIQSRDRYDILEVPIQTVYESKENHKTHFDPVWDSFKIYRIFGAIFLKYIFSSLSSCCLDLILFSIFCRILCPWIDVYYVAAATVLARIISGTYNYLINYRFVFSSKKNVGISAMKYLLLAIGIMSASALFVTMGVLTFPRAPEVALKIVVDTVLFFVSYKVQQVFVY